MLIQEVAMFRTITIAFILAVISACMCPVFTKENHVHGVLQRNERWRAENGPYIINGDLVVPENIKLTITPGTQVFIAVPDAYDIDITQQDRLDSLLSAIKIRGTLSCIGKRDARIRILPLFANRSRAAWYGIILDHSYSELTEIAFTDIVGAAYGIYATGCRPVIRNCIFEYNKVGIFNHDKGNTYAFNNVFARNFVCGARIEASNPTYYNNIFYSNWSNGLWGDDVSSLTFEYNCVYGNSDNALTGCNPKYGLLTTANENGDSTDYAHNIYADPLFGETAIASGTRSKEEPDSAPIKDTALIRLLKDDSTHHAGNNRTAKIESRLYNNARFRLKNNSPCINAGNPKKAFKDKDGSRNDMGIYGAREFVDLP